ncbi:MAG TPA: T9SS type A sorting domain-containing protein [Flavobacteriaceae bacterium]|nr:T9SS type A sorting domain-containing protein [Flavobacteriaceae bacterium]
MSLGIDEVTENANISLYPNPVQDVFNLKLSAKAAIKALTLFDLNDRPVTTFDPLQAKPQYRLNDLAEGMYFLHLLYHDGATQTLKLVKK